MGMSGPMHFTSVNVRTRLNLEHKLSMYFTGCFCPFKSNLVEENGFKRFFSSFNIAEENEFL